MDFRHAAGLYDSTMTRGLTEFGTAAVLVALCPDLIGDSTASVADAGSEKLFRKRLLVEAARHWSGGNIPDFDLFELPKKRPVFGTTFAIDFLTLAFAGLYGRDTVARWTDGTDAIDAEVLGNIDFGWLFKFNPLFLDEIPKGLRGRVLANLEASGIEQFNDEDFDNYRALRGLLDRYVFPK